MTSSVPGSAGTRSLVTVLSLCWLALVADGYDLGSYGATLPGLVGHGPFPLTVVQGGHIGSVALAGMLAGSLLAGTFTDLVGRRRLLIASVAVFSAGMIVTALAPDIEVFVTSRIVTCIGVGGLLPTAVALASEFAPAGRRSRALGAVLTGPPLGMLLAAFTASRLLPEHGFRPVYGLAGIFLLLVPALIMLLPESPAYLAARDRVGTRRSPIRGVIGPRVLIGTVLVWGATFCSLLTAFGVTTWLPQVMAASGYGLSSSLQFLVLYCLGAVVSTLVASRIADNIGPKWLVVAGFACAAGALLAISGHPATPVLYLLVLVAGFGGYGTQNVLNDFIARHYPAPIRASGLGWALAVGRIGAILGPTFGAWAVGMAAPLQATAIAFGCTALVGALVTALTPRRSKTPAQVASAVGPDRSAVPTANGRAAAERNVRDRR